MAITHKLLKLNYSVQKGEKQVRKSYSYEIAPDISKEVAKELGLSIANLIDDSIEDYSLQVTETI